MDWDYFMIMIEEILSTPEPESDWGWFIYLD